MPVKRGLSINFQNDIGYWPEMAKDSSEVQKSCMQCQNPRCIGIFICLGDKRLEKTVLKFLVAQGIASNRSAAMKIKKISPNFCQGELIILKRF